MEPIAISLIIFFSTILGALLVAMLVRRRPAKPMVIELPGPVTTEAIEDQVERERKEIDKRRALAIVRTANRKRRRAFHAARRSGASVDEAIRAMRAR